MPRSLCVHMLMASAAWGASAGTAAANTTDDQPAQVAAEPAQPAAPQDTNSEDIIVTAQKRSQSINDVGMSINAFAAEDLSARGVSTIGDLQKLVPGFTFAPTIFSTPVYTLRGVGLYDSSLGSSPSVAIYVDEVPLSFPLMTAGATLDVERVEVLKGPQGTLFGQSSTGGAINYIAAKPTSSFATGGTLSYERFGKVDAEAYVSGPLSDTLKVRVAGRAVQGGAWQRSLTRPDDRLGDSRLLEGRILADWTPTDRLSVAINVNGFLDKSDSQAAQVIRIAPGVPANVSPALLTQPLAGENPRDADWTAVWPMRSDNRFGQFSARVNYDVTDNMTLTSISSYMAMDVKSFYDYDGSFVGLSEQRTDGTMRVFNQELRLAGTGPGLNWLVGVNYDHAKVNETLTIPLDLTEPAIASVAKPFPDLDQLRRVASYLRQKINTYAVFGNVEYEIVNNLTVQASGRYTKSKREGTHCSYDVPPYDQFGNVVERLQQIFVALGVKTTPIVPVNPGECVTFNAQLSPIITPLPNSLDEDNFSWRVGVNYKSPIGLLYANASRGFKSGILPANHASDSFQLRAVKQERLDAYEVGIKTDKIADLFRVTASAFYYDYRNKQVRASLLNPIFGFQEASFNVPKSRIWGLEGSVIVTPLQGLTLSGNATYLNTKITDSFVVYNKAGLIGDFKGARLSYAPELQAVADAQYDWMISSNLRGFVGGSATHHSSDNATFQTPQTPAPEYKLRAYTLLDLRAGISSPDEAWSLMVFGRNVTNKFYETTVAQASDTVPRFAGRPAIYGLSLSVRFR